MTVMVKMVKQKMMQMEKTEMLLLLLQIYSDCLLTGTEKGEANPESQSS